jgi:hypothetical protein
MLTLTSRYCRRPLNGISYNGPASRFPPLNPSTRRGLFLETICVDRNSTRVLPSSTAVIARVAIPSRQRGHFRDWKDDYEPYLAGAASDLELDTADDEDGNDAEPEEWDGAEPDEWSPQPLHLVNLEGVA